MSVQSTGQRPAGVLELRRDAGFQQAAADRLQRRRWLPAGLVPGERVRDQAEGVLGLPVGQPVRAVLPVRDDAEPPLVIGGQAGQRLADTGQVGWPPVSLGQAQAGQQRADAQLPAAHADGQHGLDPRRGA